MCKRLYAYEDEVLFGDSSMQSNRCPRNKWGIRMPNSFHNNFCLSFQLFFYIYTHTHTHIHIYNIILQQWHPFELSSNLAVTLVAWRFFQWFSCSRIMVVTFNKNNKAPTIRDTIFYISSTSQQQQVNDTVFLTWPNSWYFPFSYPLCVPIMLSLPLTVSCSINLHQSLSIALSLPPSHRSSLI